MAEFERFARDRRNICRLRNAARERYVMQHAVHLLVSIYFFRSYTNGNITCGVIRSLILLPILDCANYKTTYN